MARCIHLHTKKSLKMTLCDIYHETIIEMNAN